MRVHFSNLGCKLNQAEVERLVRDFTAAGHSVVTDLAEADLHVVNSCTVTHAAARDSRKIARRAQRIDPAIRTVLTGCFVSSSPEEAADLAGVDLVVPNESKETLLGAVERAFPQLAIKAGIPRFPEYPYMPLQAVNTRCLVKIEDGCNMPCAFCVVPSTRGRQRSRPQEEVVAEVRSLVAAGFQEIVLTGVQISAYRRGGEGLFELVTSLLDRTEVPRLRLTSIAPWQFDRRLLGLFDGGRLCRHFHLSLQSGSDETLARMRRPYSAAAFADLVESICARIPGVAITTDVIVGFPGETDQQFLSSLDFTLRMRFARVHAFPYSRRPETSAAEMEDQVPHQAKRERMKQMLAVAEHSERAFWNGQLDSEVEILWESRRNGLSLGMTDNYMRVVSSEEQPTRQLTRGRLAGISNRGVEVKLPQIPIARQPSRRVAALHVTNHQETSHRAP